MINVNNNFDTTDEMLDNMTDEETKEYFADSEADYWIDEHKNNPNLM